jgi:hypothetical protein
MPKSFPQFSTFPLEIRLRIWRLFHRGAFLPWVSISKGFQPAKSAGGPVTLYINRESRWESLKDGYALYRSPFALSAFSKMSNINFTRDVIYSEEMYPASVVPAFAGKIERLALKLDLITKISDDTGREDMIDKFWHHLCDNYYSLKELIIILEPSPVCYNLLCIED